MFIDYRRVVALCDSLIRQRQEEELIIKTSSVQLSPANWIWGEGGGAV